MSISLQPEPGNSLLARHLGSEAAAEAARRSIRQRRREDAMRARAADRPETRADGVPEGPALAELSALRAELPSLVETEVQRVLAAELPAAVRYLVSAREATRNGKA